MNFDNQEVENQIQRADAYINLRVIGNHHNEMTFKVKKNKPLRKLMEVFSERNGLDIDNLRFLFDGNRIKDDDTPESLEMENDDSIDVMVQQTGGNS